MPSTKLIRNRIKAIKNTAKITKAMEMVAASKMKKAEDSTLKNRPYSEATYEVIFNLARQQSISHPYLNVNPKATRYLLVVITSDKGLCGSFNAAIGRKALEYIREHEPIDLITIGKKGQNYFKRLNQNILATYINFPVHPRGADIRPIIHSITEQFLSGQYKEVAVVYTDFCSILKQVPNLITLLPLGKEYSKQKEEQKEIIIKFEPSPKEVINFVIPRILEIKLYQMILESIASEQRARMLAMKNATESANELVDELNLTYNSVRQANITQELAEVSAGANMKERI